MMPRKKNLLGVIIAVALASLMVSAVLAYLDRTVLEGYTFDLVAYTAAGDRSTWAYAVTAGELMQSSDFRIQGLPSHWSLGIGSCYTIVAPPEGSLYTTPLEGYECGTTYTCTQGTYTIRYAAGLEGSTALTDGIKFETEVEELVFNNLTQVFTFTIEKAPNQDLRIGDTYVDLRTGDDLYPGEIRGPVCAPNAVAITALEARGHATWAIIGVVGLITLSVGWRVRPRNR